MARQTLAALAAACGLALILLPAPVALADNAFHQVLKDYQSDGRSGGTSSSGSGSSTTAPSGGNSAPASTAQPKAGAPPAPPPVAKPAGGTLAASTSASASASKAGTPLPIILLAILGGLLLVIGLVVWFARFMGWGMDRWQRALHTCREAGYQSENAISEFADWARRGR